MKHVRLKQLVFLIVVSLNQGVVAKVAVPPPVSDGTRVFRGYENYVEAVDPASGQVLWQTVLYKRWKPIIINPFVEEDVQWNIITSLNLDGNVLKVVGLDALNGTPVIDIKPYMPGYDSPPDAKEADWVKKLR